MRDEEPQTAAPAAGSAAMSLLREHPALLVSGIYVFASLVGMLFAWSYLRQFGVNFFDYAQVSDFLLASLKEPMTWVIVVLAVLMMVSDNALSRRWQQKKRVRFLRWYGSPRYRSLNFLILFLVIAYLIQVYARVKADLTMGGRGTSVEVLAADAAAPREALLLGTTGQFLMLYDANTRRVTIHPHENVQSVTILLPDPD